MHAAFTIAMTNSPHSDEYTVVLGSRTRRDGFSALNVKKETRSMYARGSPRDHPPPHDLRRHCGGIIEHEVPLGAFDVFGTGMARMAARALVLLLVCQPVYVAFGAELDGMVEPVEGITVVEGAAPNAENENVEDELSTDEQVSDVPLDESVAESNEEVALGSDEITEGEVLNGENTREVSEEEVAEEHATDGTSSVPNDEEGVEANDGSVDGEMSSDEPSAEGSESEADETADDGDEADASGAELDAHTDSGSSTEEVRGGSDTSEDGEGDVSLAETVATSSATSTTETEEELTERTIPIEQNAGNKYVFGESDCTVVSDGEFYCTKRSAQAVRTGRTHVYAQLDREGDREIYLARGGGVEQVTDNMIDDFAPVFDEETGRIAWHASLEDRLQILFRDPVRGMVQVTRGNENNSNPSLSGDKLVWQGWRGNDWEVFLAQHLNGDIVVEQLTQNDVHDMFPQVRGNLVSWQEEREGGAVVVVYDIDTGERTLLNKDSAGKYENPRFMLVFESKDENGDVATIGYDVVTGEEVELGTNPNKNTVPVPQTPADHTGDAVPVEAATGTSSVKTVRNERE